MINERFVSTTITIFDVHQLAQSGDELAQKVELNWSNPVSLMFLTPEGEFITLLNPIRELTDAHPDTGLRQGQKHSPSAERNAQVFRKRLEECFGKNP